MTSQHTLRLMASVIVVSLWRLILGVAGAGCYWEYGIMEKRLKVLMGGREGIAVFAGRRWIWGCLKMLVYIILVVIASL